MGKLSDVQLKAWLRDGKRIAGKSDGDGLTFTLSALGTATWTLRYRIAGRARELTLGRYPDLSLGEARKLAAAKRVDVHQVIDVAAIKQQKKAEAKLTANVEQLANLWLDNTVRRRHQHPEVTERVFKRDILPSLGKCDTKSVKTPEITRLLAKINASGRPSIANDALRYMKAMFAYGEALGMVDRNPAERIRVEHAGGQEKSRTRALSATEIAKLLKAMREAGTKFGRDNELAVKLLLALACRKMELFAAMWDEFDFSNDLWLSTERDGHSFRAQRKRPKLQILCVILAGCAVSGMNARVWPKVSQLQGTLCTRHLRKLRNVGFVSALDYRCEPQKPRLSTLTLLPLHAATTI